MDIHAARDHVLVHGQPVEPQRDPELRVNTPTDENGGVYSGEATLDQKDRYFAVKAYKTLPGVTFTEADFRLQGATYHLFIDFADSPKTPTYVTTETPIGNMPSNEYRIIRFCLDQFMERSGLIPPNAPLGDTTK